MQDAWPFSGTTYQTTGSGMRFIDQCSVVLFDLHRTLMFGSDRFGHDQDYHSTYRAVGGRRLTAEVVQDQMEACLESLLRDYESPHRFDDFPSLAEAFRRYAGTGEEDLPLLQAVFAEHERGHLAVEYAQLIRRLATTHQLGVVSNICALPDPWIAEFETHGVRESFTTFVFSSEGRSIKPSPAVFRRAMASFPPDSSFVFVGDSLERDIRPAHALGMKTVWIAPDGATDPAADRIVASALELEDIPTTAPPQRNGRSTTR